MAQMNSFSFIRTGHKSQESLGNTEIYFEKHKNGRNEKYIIRFWKIF